MEEAEEESLYADERNQSENKNGRCYSYTLSLCYCFLGLFCCLLQVLLYRSRIHVQSSGGLLKFSNFTKKMFDEVSLFLPDSIFYLCFVCKFSIRKQK